MESCQSGRMCLLAKEVGVTVPRVRIPHSPPDEFTNCSGEWKTADCSAVCRDSRSKRYLQNEMQ